MPPLCYTEAKEIEIIADHAKKNRTLKQSGKIHKCSAQTIKNILTKHGVPSNNPRKALPGAIRAKIKKMLVSGRYQQTHIAKILGVSCSTVCNMAKGLTTKKQPEQMDVVTAGMMMKRPVLVVCLKCGSRKNVYMDRYAWAWDDRTMYKNCPGCKNSRCGGV